MVTYAKSLQTFLVHFNPILQEWDFLVLCRLVAGELQIGGAVCLQGSLAVCA
jgi:hypothetical protein